MPIKDILDLEGIKILDKNIFFSDLGYFTTIFSVNDLDVDFVQDSISKSMQAGTIRGLHFQRSNDAQAKLVNVIQGSILDFVVDLRQDSNTFLCHGCIELNHQSSQSLFIPKGFAHGFITLEPETIISYKLDNLYNPDSEETLLWNDPDIGIIWPKMEQYYLSPKDEKGSSLKEILKKDKYYL